MILGFSRMLPKRQFFQFGEFLKTEDCENTEEIIQHANTDGCGNKKAPDIRGFFLCLAERGGFEPPIGYEPIHAFQACDLNHSSTSPGFGFACAKPKIIAKTFGLLQLFCCPPKKCPKHHKKNRHGLWPHRFFQSPRVIGFAY